MAGYGEGQLRNDYIAQRMQNGGQPPDGGGCGCPGAILALVAVIIAIGMISNLAVFVIHFAEHLMH